jgi:hypothetical protein
VLWFFREDVLLLETVDIDCSAVYVSGYERIELNPDALNEVLKGFSHIAALTDEDAAVTGFDVWS